MEKQNKKRHTESRVLFFLQMFRSNISTFLKTINQMYVHKSMHQHYTLLIPENIFFFFFLTPCLTQTNVHTQH